MTRTALIALLCFASGALAEVSPDVKKYVGSASALFEKLEYEKALAQLKRAKAKSQGPEDDLRIALLEGIVLAEMGDANAPAAFASALGMEPNVTLPMVVSPKVQRVFDKAKAQVQRVLAAEAEVERQKAEEKRKQEEASRPPPPVEKKPEPAPVVVEQPKPQPQTNLRAVAIVPAAIGVVSAGVGTVLLFQAKAAQAALKAGTPANKDEAIATANRGASMQIAGWALVGVGAAAVVAAGALFALGPGNTGATASVFVAPGPGGLSASASLSVPLP